MRLLHAASKTRARFDDANLVSHAGLVPAVRLLRNVELDELVTKHVRLADAVGANAGAKVSSLVAGMVAGADTIDGMDLLRHGALPDTFGGVRAPSTLGSFLRGFNFGNVRQLEAVHRRTLVSLAEQTPLLPGADTLAFVDIDSVQRPVYGGNKQGAGFGHTKVASKSVLVRGLNVLLATVSTPQAAPVVAAARRRGGTANSGRGGARLVTEAINTAREARATGMIVVRADSAYYSGVFIAACRRQGVRFSVTVRMNPSIARAIDTIGEDDWVSIKYPNAIYDEDTGQWISDAQIARVRYTAFAAKRQHRTQGWLMVRRVKALNPKATAQGQGELFTAYRYHAVFTDSPFELVQAEAQHRGHAVIEQLNADLIDGPLAHLPSGDFQANAAWLQLAITAHAVTRALGALASTRHAVARGATIRRELIQIAAQPARTGRDQITWHLPRDWPWQDAWLGAFTATHHPPPTPRRLAKPPRPPPGPTGNQHTWIRRMPGRRISHALNRKSPTKDQLISGNDHSNLDGGFRLRRATQPWPVRSRYIPGHAGCRCPQSPGQGAGRQSVCLAVFGECVQEGVGGGVVGLSRLAEDTGGRGEQYERRQVQVAGQLVQMPGRVHFRSQDSIHSIIV